MYYIGLDLGTSALKGLLLDENGTIVREAAAHYAVSYPHDGWSEQDPEDWMSAAIAVISSLSEGLEKEVAGISAGGQMHGLVILDEEDNVIRPAILWNDGRTAEETAFLNETVGRERLSALTANIAFAGYTAPKLLWLKKHEPQNFARIRKICLPKDFLAYRLTGVFSTDVSDASGTLFFDVKNRRWSKEMLEICSVREEWLPRVFESGCPTGMVHQNILPHAVFTAGAGDNAAAAIGTGTLKNGDCNLSLGTSGTVFVACDEFCLPQGNTLHAFAHANGKWHLMGCILSAASCNRWWLEEILRSVDYEGAAAAELGENGVFFLPYLMGERCPHNDVNARGAFIGMCANTTREEMCLAVLEGVAFALRDCVEAVRRCGIGIGRATVCGGGAKSALWRKILANVLGCEIVSLQTEQGPAYGAAMLAMVGCGRSPDADCAAKEFVHPCETIVPETELVRKYEEKYRIFTRLYPALAPVFRDMADRG